ncbi:MAG: cell wall hydrolase [Pseudorhodoplanes sp.]|nr:hypothetical protein [Pseudorhodoplanes sp.]MBW7949174.1 cell wall hydrolase [Pseudorhodoplanes sp.]
MSASRRRPKRGRVRRFGLTVFLLTMMPTSIGYQDLAALIARQPAVSERWRQHTYSSTFATFRTATFSFPQPVGTLIPTLPGYSFASIDPRSIDLAGTLGLAGRSDPFAEPPSAIVFPQVDRSRKGDRLMPRRPAQPAEPLPLKEPAPAPKAPKMREALPQEPAAPAPQQPQQSAVPQNRALAKSVPPSAVARAQDGGTGHAPATLRQAETPAEAGIAAAPLPGRAPALEMDAVFDPVAAAAAAVPQPARTAGLEPEAEFSPLAEPRSEPAPGHEVVAALPADPAPQSSAEPLQDENGVLTDDEPGGSESGPQAGAPADNPAIEMAKLFFGNDALGPDQNRIKPWREGEAPVLIPLHPSVDPDIKRAAIDPGKAATDAPSGRSDGETVAPKGEVTGADKRPKSPAERLGLTGAARAKHERCLTNAIYFEARGEPERGQMAVAQVVLNRVFSQYYPDNVCGVVYQNAHRHLACQFTFACDNVRDVVTEPDAWEVAKRIARDSLDGKIWLPEIGKATHYHATYVNPWWVRTMKKHQKLGIHIFYRPTRWGDGSDEPKWGPVAETVTGSVSRTKTSATN